MGEACKTALCSALPGSRRLVVYSLVHSDSSGGDLQRFAEDYITGTMLSRGFTQWNDLIFYPGKDIKMYALQVMLPCLIS